MPNQDSIVPCRESQDDEDEIQMGFDRNTVVFMPEEAKNDQ